MKGKWKWIGGGLLTVGLVYATLAWAGVTQDLARYGMEFTGRLLKINYPLSVKIGNGTPGVTQNGEDLYVEGTVEIDDLATLDGGLTVTGNITSSGGDISHTGDLIVQDSITGGAGGGRNQFIGLPRIKMVDLATGTNGTTETVSYLDDTPEGEWAPIDADVTESGDTTTPRVGSKSYKMIFAATATSGDGAKATITSDNLEANEYVGGWIRSSVALAAGDIQLLLTDDGGARVFPTTVPIQANVWTWVEFDVSTLDAGTGDAVTEVGLTLTAGGATNLAAFNLWVDVLYKWDSDDEEALGVNMVQDGVLGIVTVPTLAATANTLSVPAEFTDFFTAYHDGNDGLVWITNQSANEAVATIAYR